MTRFPVKNIFNESRHGMYRTLTISAFLLLWGLLFCGDPFEEKPFPPESSQPTCNSLLATITVNAPANPCINPPVLSWTADLAATQYDVSIFYMGGSAASSYGVLQITGFVWPIDVDVNPPTMELYVVDHPAGSYPMFTKARIRKYC